MAIFPSTKNSAAPMPIATTVFTDNFFIGFPPSLVGKCIDM
jgi:hypothetical protein